MATEPQQNQEQQEQHEQRREHAANADATHREAYEYWGYLLKSDKCGTPLLDRLLKGIAEVIVSCGATKAICVVVVELEHVGADGATVEQAVRAQRLARPHAVADCSMVPRCRRRLRSSLQRHAAVLNCLYLPLAGRIPQPATRTH